MRAQTIDAAFDVENLIAELETALGKLEALAEDGTALAEAADVVRERLTGLRAGVRQARERDCRGGKPSWMPEQKGPVAA